jgi:hypothetical protein
MIFMDSKALERLIRAVSRGELSPRDAMNRLKHFHYEDLEIAKVDHHRALRQGIPEVILARGKRVEDVAGVASAMYRKSKSFLITKASEEIYNALEIKAAKYHPASGIITAGGRRGRKNGGVLVISAGTSDLPVAEETALTASFLGSRVHTLYDVGVAGIHRLLEHRGLFAKSRVVVVTAGMEGALPSVVGGITDRPVIAVPTSVGYGASLGGLTALFAMLNSCVPGIAVMNIDNGFGAGCLAHKINTI